MDSSLIALVLIALVLVGLLSAVMRFTKPRLNKEHFAKKWREVENESNHMLAIIKADSLVDEALKHAHIKGNTMGERLNHAAGLLRDLNGAWGAHKLRNRLVHETDTNVTAAQYNFALRQCKKALKDLGAL